MESKKGIQPLKSITVSATFPNIGVEKLKSISIPLPNMQEQERIADKYLATLSEITVIKLNLDKAMSWLSHIIDDDFIRRLIYISSLYWISKSRIV